MLAAPGLGPPASLPCKDMERVSVQPFPFEVEERYRRNDLYPPLDGVYYDQRTIYQNPDLLAGLHVESQEIHEMNPDGTLGKAIQRFGPEIVPVSVPEARTQRDVAIAGARDKVVVEAGDGSGIGLTPVMAPGFGVTTLCQHMPYIDGGDLSVFVGQYNYASNNYAVVTVGEGNKLVWSQFYSGGATADAVYDLIPADGSKTFRASGAGTGSTITIERDHLTHSATAAHQWTKQPGMLLPDEMIGDLAKVAQRYGRGMP